MKTQMTTGPNTREAPSINACGPNSRWAGRAKRLIMGITLAAAVMMTNGMLFAAGPAPVVLGEATHFTLLAGTTITYPGAGTVDGDIGVHPGGGASTLVPAAAVTGIVYSRDAGYTLGASLIDDGLLNTAKIDLDAAYGYAAGLPAGVGPNLNPGAIPGHIGGMNLAPGIYTFDTSVDAIIDGADLTLTGGPDDVWVFQMGRALDVEAGVNRSVILAGGAQAKNVFWQVSSSATLGTYSDFKGTIMAYASVILDVGSRLDGRALARTAQVVFGGLSANMPKSNLTLTIISEHGVGTPLAGLPPNGIVYTNSYGAALTNSITAVEANGGTQYVNTGWSMIGNSPETGVTNGMSMVLTNNAVLTWLWSTNYLLTASADSGGGVTGSSNGFYVAGSTVVVTATPSLGNHFTGWTGDVGGADTNDAALTLLMDQARTVVAHFDDDAANLLTLTIISEHGLGTPLAGLPPNGIVYTNSYGAALTNSITAVEANGGTQYVNTGWSMLGNSPETGVTNGMSMALTNNAVLTWLWTTNYYLSLTALHGSITNATPGWKPADEAFTLYPVPDAGYTFDHWEVNGINQSSGVPLNVTMDRANNVIAVFSPLFVDVTSQVIWRTDWVFDPRKGYFIGTLTITNPASERLLVAPFWFEVQSTEWHWLRSPTGLSATGKHYLDISAAVNSQLRGIGNRDQALDPGESVSVTGIELMGRRTTDGLVVAVWADPPATVLVSNTGDATLGQTQPNANVGATFTQSLPVWAQGTFNGYLADGGAASMKVTAKGKVTGKLTIGGKSYAFKAASYVSAETAEEGYSLVANVKVGTTLLPLTLLVSQPLVPLPQTLSVASGQLGSSTQVVLYRDVWKETGAALAPPVGYYTATLPGNGEYGSGYLTFTVNVAGNVRVAGKLADRTSVSQSGTLLLDGDGRVFAALYTAPKTYMGGGLFGLVEFVKPEDGPVVVRLLATPILWTSQNPKATGDYGQGFSRELGMTGGWYDKLGSLDSYYRTSALSFDTGTQAPLAGFEAGWDADRIALLVKGGGAWGTGSENPTGLKVNMTRATGVFKGSFRPLSDGSASQPQKAILFEGVLTPERENKADGITGRGFFLWADTASDPQGRVASYGFSWSYDIKMLQAETGGLK